jgi:hypothetical protein
VYCTLHCTFTVYFLSLSRTDERDSDVFAWVRRQRKMSQVLGAFGLLDFTMLRPILAWRAFWNLWIVYFFKFPTFFSCCGKPRILNLQIRGHTYIYVYCWCVIWSCGHYNALTCMTKVWANSEWGYEPLWFINYPDDGTLVPKHVEVGSWYEVCFVIRLIVLISAICWFFKRKYGT